MQGKIAVIGGGSWGTALGNLMSENDYNVTIYALEQEVVRGINLYNENPLFLKGSILDKNLKAEFLEKFKGGYDKVLWAVPTQFTRETLKKMGSLLAGKSIIVATKGIEINTGELIIEIISDMIDANLSILSGPSFAKEVANRKPTAVSIASKDKREAEKWQEILSNSYFRAYTTDDVVGVEVGGAIKNVIAIATGICDGLQLGHNARAGIITRGLAEITRLGISLGGKKETFMGLSGMGDLVLTCTGDLSRNRSVGLKIAEGYTLEEILKNMKMVAEGVFTAKAVKNLSEKLNIEMPISNEIYEILYNNKNPKQSLLDLMNRPLKEEHA
ncbi:NAD(P)-dependent glycerol-3-phosphate dehydrogenase [Deferribacterales bacterium Es71-Z0220]|uniref:NAD(P)H-dependent glycerol-3-phosphate dehydrogenase n=1 Tax=Deferrivibrio essentukiensis TaxID=2880922 RepID=UPI001F60439E|nr:NAD(P)H-dependent glycerol-3-phosphate dehydrogenase [Deferrivibrio essentukiensis]MCB4203683.1 NAD(P)-dependent glycerol-3-phosphate dehydrogenase [Deferrivibrio essentukiensis]